MTAIAAVSLATASPVALAQTAYRDANPERGSLVLGLFVTDQGANTRLDSDQGQGSEIDLENDLGFKASNSVSRLGGYLWFAPRQRLDFTLFDLSRDASQRISETIEFGDEIFAVDTTVYSQFDVHIGKIDYTFAALNRERGYVGVTGGLYVAQFKLALSEATLGTAESEDLTAPLPVIGLRGAYDISPRFTLRGAAQIFKLESGDVDGRLTDFYVGVDYEIGQRWAVGLAYNDVGLDVDADEDGGYVGALDWGYDGFMLYTKLDFGR